MAEPISRAERAALLAAMDDPLTDSEALTLIAELVTIVCAVTKVATPDQQRILVKTMVRAGNLPAYVQQRFAQAGNMPKAPADDAAREGHDG